MLKLNNQEISSIYFNNQKINRYYFNGVMYEFDNPLINYDWSITTAKEYKTDGVELVVNGGFDSSDTSNLIPNTAAASIVKENGAGRFISTEAWRYVEDASVVTYPFVVGKTYLYKFDVLETNASLRVGNASELLVVTEAGSYEFAFTYQIGLARGLRISAYTTPVNALIDNISIQKVIQEPNKRYLRDVGSTPTYNASMYFGRGAYLNGVDQTITVPINATIQTSLKRVNGVVTINETSQILTNYVISGLGVHKDYYLFTRLLTTAEKDSYTNTPELFYAMAQADSTCVLNMPMCETDKYVRNMKSYSEVVSSNADFNTTTGGWTRWSDGDVVSIADGNLVCTLTNGRYIKLDNVGLASGYVHIEVDYSITTGDKGLNAFSGSPVFWLPYSDTGTTVKWIIGSNGTTVALAVTSGISDVVKYSKIKITKLYNIYPITNYTSSVRDNAKNLQYGLQTCKFVRDSLGVIQTASDYLECDGSGYAIIPNHADTVNIKMTVNPTSLSGNLLSGGVTKALTGLTLNVDNDVVISNVTPTGAITLASGFTGTIKSYKEEL